MEQNSNDTPLNSAHYNVSLFKWRRGQLGWTNTKITGLLNVCERTVYVVFKGQAKYQSVRAVADLLGLDWALVHDLTLPESHYHLAVRHSIDQGAHLIAPSNQTDNSLPAANP